MKVSSARKIGFGVGASRSRGFTLLEVLLAMAITGLVAVMGYAGLSAAMSAAERHGEQVKRLGEVQAALAYLVRDLRQSIDRPIVDARGDLEPALIGNASEEEFLSLTHVGWDNPRGQRRGSVQRVRYRLDANGDLWREYWLVLDRVDEEDHLQSVKLLSNVDRVQLQFMKGEPRSEKKPKDSEDKSGEQKAPKKKRDSASDDEWTEQWPPEDSELDNVPMPLAVKVELEIRDIGSVHRVVGLANEQPE